MRIASARCDESARVAVVPTICASCAASVIAALARAGVAVPSGVLPVVARERAPSSLGEPPDVDEAELAQLLELVDKVLVEHPTRGRPTTGARLVSLYGARLLARGARQLWLAGAEGVQSIENPARYLQASLKDASWDWHADADEPLERLVELVAKRGWRTPAFAPTSLRARVEEARKKLLPAGAPTPKEIERRARLEADQRSLVGLAHGEFVKQRIAELMAGGGA